MHAAKVALPTLLCFVASAGAAGPIVGTSADFTRTVKPILATRCVSCHGPEKQRASLRLDAASHVRQGGSSGPAVVPGQSAASLLMKAVRCEEGVKPMPPKGPRLNATELEALRAWIDAGALVPAGEAASTAVLRSRHWAFQPLARPQLPA